ncbi:MAG: DUF3553 domain-containing protein [Alphaproteobacteria bacterium]|nr:MAG: DUF3553 domain-containing protein [Alphaproteobacteria bacterium]
MLDILAPGAYVRLPEKPDWGIGQVQSVIGNRVTINFEHAGKQLIRADKVDLVPIDPKQEQRKQRQDGQSD